MYKYFLLGYGSIRLLKNWWERGRNSGLRERKGRGREGGNCKVKSVRLVRGKDISHSYIHLEKEKEKKMRQN